VALTHILGCWEWDGDAGCIVNHVTAERLHFVSEEASSGSPWQMRSFLFRYQADDLQCDVAVAVSQEFRAARSGVFWRSMHSGVQLVTVYQVDFGQSAQASGCSQLPFGVWQRLTEFLPEAILFWPESLPGVADPANGPGAFEAARCVRAIGMWANGSWNPVARIEYMIKTSAGLNHSASCHLMDKQYWRPADLALSAPPPLVFVDGRTAEEAAKDRSPWPNLEGVKHWLAERGFVGAVPGDTPIAVPSGLFDKAPHCRSDDGSRYFFFNGGVRVRSWGHSLPSGPGFELISGGIRFSGEFYGLREDLPQPTNDSVKLTGSAHRSGSMKFAELAEKSIYVYSRPTLYDAVPLSGQALTQEGHRLVWQSMLDAFVSWRPQQGIIPAERERSSEERQKGEGSDCQPWPANDLRMGPLSWLDMTPPSRLAGIDAQSASPLRRAFRWDALKSFVFFDLAN